MTVWLKRAFLRRHALLLLVIECTSAWLIIPIALAFHEIALAVIALIAAILFVCWISAILLYKGPIP